MSLDEFKVIIEPIPAQTFAKTMERLLLVDARLALEAQREQAKSTLTAAQTEAQGQIETLTAQINALQTRIDAL